MGLLVVAWFAAWGYAGYLLGRRRDRAALGTVAGAIAGPIGILLMLIVTPSPRRQRPASPGDPAR